MTNVPSGDSQPKGDGSGRKEWLAWSKKAEEQLQDELRDNAREKCHDQLRDFSQCAKEEGLLVVFKCQEIHKKLIECMKKYSNAEMFEKYKAEREKELLQGMSQE